MFFPPPDSVDGLSDDSMLIGLLKKLVKKPHIGIDYDCKCTDVKLLLGAEIKGPALF